MKRRCLCRGGRSMILAILVLAFFIPTSGFEADWQTTWDKWVAGAKKEGTLRIYSSAGPETHKVYMEAMISKYGIKVDVITGKTNSYVTKIVAERNAGLYLGDVLLGGTNDIPGVLKPIGALECLDPVLILPEVTNKEAWWGNDLLWEDKAHTSLCFSAKPQVSISINTDLVKPGEIKSYKDLLNPKWKGKIVQDDPTHGAGTAAWVFTMAKSTMNIEYLREFLRTQRPFISTNTRLSVEGLARGKWAVGIGLGTKYVYDMSEAGAPIKFIQMAEGTYLTAGGGCLYMLDKAPHPNAAKVFINWLLGKEGGTVYSRTYGAQSARNDVPTDHLPPEQIRQPGAKYFMTLGEETTKEEYEFRKTIVELYKPLMQ